MSPERTAALGGVLFVALDIVVGAMAGAPPSPAAPDEEIVAVLGALSNEATSNTISLIGFALWLVWILGVSQRMWSDDARTEPSWS